MTMPDSEASGPDSKSHVRVIWVLWMTYGSFYFCRANIAAAVPGIEAELELSKTQMGTILGSLKLAYGIGQFWNGQIAERVSPRIMLTVGMLVSVALNLIFGLAFGFYFLIFVWMCNGYAQSLGWTPCMRVASNWFPATTRGRMIGIIGTGYQVTLALTYLVSGLSVKYLGWRAAFYVPSVLLFLSCLHMRWFLEETPKPQTEELADESARRRPGWLGANLKATVQNPAVWYLGAALGLLNACRYGFLDWGLSHLSEVQEGGVLKAGVKYAVLPLGGIAGAYLAGVASDRMGGRRAPMIFILLIGLGLTTLAYKQAVELGTVPTVLILLLIGFFIAGPQVLLVGTAPVDFARKGTSAAAVGFVNFMGYLGAFTGDQVTGSMVDDHGWGTAVIVWACFAFGGALAVVFLWKATAVKEQV
ncbi:MAG: hypothetical protein CMJ83_07425 [Planctomycetes bacterium]|nr:hypothetical protein [Planctomycetota bacterium]